jgi:hypothetical protein
MGSARTAGGITTAILSAAALAVPSTAQAQPATTGVRVVKVPCSASALANEVAAANAIPAVLQLRPFCPYQITATLTVSGQVALVGGRATSIRPATGFTGRLLDVTSTGRLRVEGISILSGNGNAGDEGVGIRNAGNLVLNFVTISGNTANNGNGGGLSNLQGATARIANTLITGNNATGSAGAGTGGGGGIINRGTLTVIKTRLSANTAADGGGAIDTLPTGRSTFFRSTFDHNFAGGSGGAIFNSGTTSLDRSLVVRNRAGVTGGGIFQNAGTTTVTRSIIRNNIPNNCAPANSVPGCTG